MQVQKALILALSLVVSPTVSGRGGGELFELRTDKLDSFYHRAATMTLLKAKAQELLRQPELPQLERIVFRECVADGANTPAKYAKCLLKLIRARDAMKSQTEVEEGEIIGGEKGILEGTMGWLTGLAQGLAWKVPNMPVVKWATEPSEQGTKKKANPIVNIHGGTTNRKSGIVAFKVKKRRPNGQRRRKRRIAAADWMQREHLPKNIGALKKLQQHIRRMEWAQKYIGRISEHNSRLIRRHLPNCTEPFRFEQSTPTTQIAELIRQALNGSLNGKHSSLSVLSPRLFSIFPSNAAKGRAKLLSPDLLNFHNGNGLFSLPQLFGMFSPDQAESLEWMELMLEMSGASKSLQSLMQKMHPEMEDMEKRVWPALRRLKQMERRWKKLRGSLSREQRKNVHERGFATLERWQQKLLGDEVLAPQLDDQSLEQKIELLAAFADEENEHSSFYRLNRVKRGEDREKLPPPQGTWLPPPPANSPHHHRPHPPPTPKEGGFGSAVVFGRETDERFWRNLDRDQQHHHGDRWREEWRNNHPQNNVQNGQWWWSERNTRPYDKFEHHHHHHHKHLYHPANLLKWKESPDTERPGVPLPRTVALSPWAFEHRFGGVVLEGVYLSPHAFASELVSPEILTIHALSPSAFMASILSPAALASRILSPRAFRAEILGPEALTAYVLSPDVFMAEVLSPKVLQARVGSPKGLFLQLLNPYVASPRLGSPQTMGLVVLSPNFLSPRFDSQESMMIEVLSPHIMGGEHESHNWNERDTPDQGGAVHYVG